MTNLGQELKKERENKGISLKEISLTTRISMRYLEAVENDQFDVFPGPFFIKAVIRSYAKAIGLDENQVIARYRQVLGASQPNLGEKAQDSIIEAPPSRPGKAGIYIAVMIAAAAVATWIIARKPKPSLLSAKPQSAALKVPAPTPSPIELKIEPPAQPSVQAKTAEQLPPQDQALDFAASFKELTWIQVWADGDIKLNGLMEAGRTFSTKAQRELRINLGNAGGFVFTLNGKRGKPFGMRGEVVKDIYITPATLQSFTQPEQNPIRPERP